MATAIIDGITTRYEVLGDGPPLLMFSPGGFDATHREVDDAGHLRAIKLLDHLPRQYTCIVFDRRETGQSGGRVERLTWEALRRARQGSARCTSVYRARPRHRRLHGLPAPRRRSPSPIRRSSTELILYWPVGGAQVPHPGPRTLRQHLAYAQQHGLAGVVALAASSEKSFGGDPRGGPWVSVHSPRSQRSPRPTRALDPDAYQLLLTVTARTLFDRDTAPGAEPEDLLRLDLPALIVPGRDHAHAVSAARYLEECLGRAEYWDVPVEAQTEASTASRLLTFLGGV